MVEYAFAYDQTGAMAGPYSSEQFARFMLFSLAANKRPNAGVIWDSDSGAADPLNVNETAIPSKAVRVRPGAAFVNGRWYYTDSDVTLTIADNTDPSGFARIDYCVLRRNVSTRITSPVILQGTPSGSPVAPTLTQNATVWEIPLATIAVANLFTTITNANITNTVREFARQLNIREGGIGPLNYLDREHLVGDGSGLLVHARWDVAKFLLTHTAGGARSSNSVSAAGAFQTVPFTSEAVDQDDNFSLASNQINVNATGVYLLLGAQIVCDANVSVRLEFRLRNVTQSVTIQQSVTGFATTAPTEIQHLGAAIFSATASDKLELQIDGSLTATVTYGDPTATAVDGVMKDIVLTIMRIR